MTIETDKNRHNTSAYNSFKRLEIDLFKTTIVDTIVFSILSELALPFVPAEHKPTFRHMELFFPFVNYCVRQGVVLTELAYQKYNPENQDSIFSRGFRKVASLINSVVPAYLFGEFHLITIASLAHEFGHYYASQYFDKDTSPNITLSPTGGFTDWIKKVENRQTIFTLFQYRTPSTKCPVEINAAGPAAELALASAEIAMAHCFKADKTVKYYLNTAAIYSIVSLLGHAYSSFNAVDSGIPYDHHDFAMLWKDQNLHPYAAMIGIVAIPIIVKSTLVLVDDIAAKISSRIKV